MTEDSVQQSHQSQFDHPEPPVSPRRSRIWLYLLIALTVVIAAVLLGWLPREKTAKQVTARAAEETNALPVAEVIDVYQASLAEQLTLPGTVAPASVIHIYSRAPGFLKARYVDIGDKVHKDELLAVVSAPELDAAVMQQRSLLLQSKSALSTAISQQNLQQITYDRIHTLVSHGVLSQQDDDVALAALKAAKDNVGSAEGAVNATNATLSGAVALASFERIVAPIDGVVTARNVEVGSLISTAGAGEGLTPAPVPAQSGGPPTGGAQGNELFEIAGLRDLLVFVTVPEGDAPFVQTGQPATLTFSELPTERFNGSINRSSDSLSQQTRTLLLEIRVSDPQHRLRPGMFASVQLGFNATNRGILVPGDSIIPRAQGQFVAVVQNGVVHLEKVQVGRDLGTQVYVTAGLNDGAQVVVNPTDSIQEGKHVRVLPAPKGQAQ